MARASLVEQIRNYRLKHPDESSVADQFIAFIEANEDCFERSLEMGHITGSAWVINAAGTHVLLTHHRKLNKWLQLGGHADGCGDVLQVAMREVEEESGLGSVVPVVEGIFDLDVHAIPARAKEPEHLHYDIRYLLQTGLDENYVVSEESHDLGWISLGELGQFTEERSMHRMARKCLASLTLLRSP